MKNVYMYLVVTHRPYQRHRGLFRDLAFKIHTLGYQYEVSYFIMTNFGEGNRGGIQFPPKPKAQIKLSLQATNVTLFPDFVVNNMVYCEKVYVVKSYKLLLHLEFSKSAVT